MSCGAIKSPLGSCCCVVLGPKYNWRAGWMPFGCLKLKKSEDHFSGLFCKPAKKDIGATNGARADGLPMALNLQNGWYLVKVCIRHQAMMPLYSILRMPSKRRQMGSWRTDWFTFRRPPMRSLRTNFAIPKRPISWRTWQARCAGATLLPHLCCTCTQGTISLRPKIHSSTNPRLSPTTLINDVDRMIALMKGWTFRDTKNFTWCGSTPEVLKAPRRVHGCLLGRLCTYPRCYVVSSDIDLCIGKVVDLELEGYGCQGLRIAGWVCFRRTLATPMRRASW
jgi:hypothetical protein